jgi:hypothetical protein
MAIKPRVISLWSASEELRVNLNNYRERLLQRYLTNLTYIQLFNIDFESA